MFQLGAQLAFADDQKARPRLCLDDVNRRLDKQVMAFAWVQRADGRDEQCLGRKAKLAAHR